MIHYVDVLDSNKGGFRESVTYEADGVEITVTGEFRTDSEGNRYHTHIFDDGTEIDVIF